ncbi:MAG: acetylglutamate kinase [Magnetovibrio sp.]|nr:acetylglutamate kinase [Magnetovibrio sp.]|tara:strand:+ start:1739 stop:2653 length:915 start_codon:yes stop_codon:yes gene_type:complete
MDDTNENTGQNPEVLQQAKVLSEALPYMRRFAGETVVIKYGGNAMSNNSLAELFARDMVLLRQVGLNPVIVHGGGPQIGSMLDKLGIQSQFIDGLRVTDEKTIDIIEMVLTGSINKKIVSDINSAGGYAVGLSGKDGHLILAEKLKLNHKNLDSTLGDSLDLGLVGEPAEINPHVLDALAKNNITPVIAPVGCSKKGETLNINADTVAGSIAGALGAKRLYMLTDVQGVMDKEGKLIPTMTISKAENYISDGTIQGGMIPKIKNCIKVIKNGVNAATIIDGRVPHAVLMELFTTGGAGTQITID